MTSFRSICMLNKFNKHRPTEFSVVRLYIHIDSTVCSLFAALHVSIKFYVFWYTYRRIYRKEMVLKLKIYIKICLQYVVYSVGQTELSSRIFAGHFAFSLDIRLWRLNVIRQSKNISYWFADRYKDMMTVNAKHWLILITSVNPIEVTVLLGPSSQLLRFIGTYPTIAHIK